MNNIIGHQFDGDNLALNKISGPKVLTRTVVSRLFNKTGLYSNMNTLVN